MMRACAGAVVALAAAAPAFPQPRTLSEGAHRMQILLDRREGSAWREIDPGLVLASGDRVRFRFRTNFDGYLYVSNRGSSGKYEQLFPRPETGEDNRILAGKEYEAPATASLFRIAGPPGYELVYWLVSPSPLSAGAAEHHGPALRLEPRCDDAILKARGDCVDSSAGPRLEPPATNSRPDLLLMRQENTAVFASKEPLKGPVVFEYRLAHR
jgi:Domain of unknown function (DUF4384)